MNSAHHFSFCSGLNFGGEDVASEPLTFQGVQIIANGVAYVQIAPAPGCRCVACQSSRVMLGKPELRAPNEDSEKLGRALRATLAQREERPGRFGTAGEFAGE